MIDEIEKRPSKTESLKIPNFDFSDEIDDLDNFNFKPINEGLGFHREKKEIKRKPIVRRGLGPVAARNQPLPDHNSLRQGPAQGHAGELTAFYNSSVKQDNSFTLKKENKIEVSQLQRKEVLASLPLQIAAWLVDIILISLAMALTLWTLALASGLETSLLTKMMIEREVLFYVISLFIIYFLLYFSVLDLVGTFGKTLVGIRLYTTGGQPLRIKHTFIRSLVTLTSFIAIGLPLLMNFQGRLSETKVLR